MNNKVFAVVTLTVAIALAAVTQLIPNEYFFSAAYTVLLFVTLATAWNILGGYTGYVNFGSAAFFALGAYTSVFFHKTYPLPIPVLILIGGIVSGIVGFLIGYMLPRFWVGRRIAGRLSAFNKQLPDTITLLSNSLRAGSSFLQSIELVSREGGPPMSEEMGRVVREVNLGLGMEEALSNIVRRIRSDDLDLMVTAIGVQQQVGGNLAEILDTIAFTIRERVRIKGEIRTLTAQGRYSGYLVAFLPVGIAVTLNFINPEFMQPLFTQLIGQILLVIGGVMMAIGFFAIRKITDIKV